MQRAKVNGLAKIGNQAEIQRTTNDLSWKGHLSRPALSSLRLSDAKGPGDRDRRAHSRAYPNCYFAPTLITPPSVLNVLFAASQMRVWKPLKPIRDVGVLCHVTPVRSIGEA